MQQELVDQHHRSSSPGKAARIGCEGAGASLIASHPGRRTSRDVLDNLPASRLAFRVFDTTSTELVQPLAAALCHTRKARVRRYVRPQVIGRGRRGGRGFCARFCLAASGAAISALVSCSGWVSSRSSMASSKLLDQQPARSEMPELLAPCLGQHQLQPFDFQAADSHFALRQRQQFALRKDHRVRSGKVGGKRIGGVVTLTIQPYSPLKIPQIFLRESKKPQLNRSLRTPGLPAASASQFRTGDR